MTKETCRDELRWPPSSWKGGRDQIGIAGQLRRNPHADPNVELGARVITAMQAGLAAGGEAGPIRSAGLVVVDREAWPLTDLRVDWHDEPLAELARLWDVWQPQMHDYVTRALNPSGAPSYGVPGDA